MAFAFLVPKLISEPIFAYNVFIRVVVPNV